MEKEKLQQPAEHPAPKQPYAPPKATFIPLKLEERLLVCSKVTGTSHCSGPKSAS
jgi:hypothetical protein